MVALVFGRSPWCGPRSSGLLTRFIALIGSFAPPARISRSLTRRCHKVPVTVWQTANLPLAGESWGATPCAEEPQWYPLTYQKTGAEALGWLLHSTPTNYSNWRHPALIGWVKGRVDLLGAVGLRNEKCRFCPMFLSRHQVLYPSQQMDHWGLHEDQPDSNSLTNTTSQSSVSDTGYILHSFSHYRLQYLHKLRIQYLIMSLVLDVVN